MLSTKNSLSIQKHKDVESKRREERRSRWQSRKMMPTSPSPMNASKIHLHMERLLLKTNFRLAEKLLYKQDCKKYSHRMWYEEKRNMVSGLCPWEGLRNKRRITRVKIPPGGVISLNHTLDTPALGSTPVRRFPSLVRKSVGLIGWL